MNAKVSLPDTLLRMGGATLRWLLGGWRIVLFGVVVLSLALSPTTYQRENRHAIAYQLSLIHI